MNISFDSSLEDLSNLPPYLYSSDGVKHTSPKVLEDLVELLEAYAVLSSQPQFKVGSKVPQESFKYLLPNTVLKSDSFEIVVIQHGLRDRFDVVGSSTPIMHSDILTGPLTVLYLPEGV